ncbi:hypothetical protein ACQEVB_11670 [Pseudonocardia sp. CA-107938]|uniref:hypothetical protein n=1 Tax=Pseudonocardia sp. CA-107938 TaxID=3240021 RepID=UPI003D91B277
MIAVDLVDLRDHNVTVEGHPVTGIERNLARAMRLDDIADLAAVDALVWIDMADADDTGDDVQPGHAWFTAIGVADDAGHTELAYVEAHLVDSGVAILSPALDDEPHRPWFATELAADEGQAG